MKIFVLILTVLTSLSVLGQTTPLSDSVSGNQLTKMRAIFQAIELQSLSNKAKADVQYAELKSFIKSNPKSPQFILWGKYLDTLQLDTLYSLIDISIRTQLQEGINHQRIRSALQPGMRFPDLILTDTLNNQLSISSLKGKVVLINVWASWCKPCREEIPQLIKLHQQYKDRGLVVIGISLDDDKVKWLNAIRKDGQPWQQFCELKAPQHSSMFNKWGITGIPYNFLINKEGMLVDKELGIDSLESKIKQLL